MDPRALYGEVILGADVVVGDRCLIFNAVILYEGVQLGVDCVVEDRVRVGYDTTVGAVAAAVRRLHL